MATGNICAHLVATKTTADDFKWGLKRWVEEEKERREREREREREERERQIMKKKERVKEQKRVKGK